MKPEYLAFLKELGIETVPHERGSLYSHLTGTYNYLASWGCEEYVCAAGLFHSIYGTAVFRNKVVSYAERPRIQRLLGERAEDLVYLFSTIDRPLGLIAAIRDGYVVETALKRKIPVSQKKLGHLIEIEVANLLEQGGGRLFFQKLLQEASVHNFPLREVVRLAVQTAVSSSM